MTLERTNALYIQGERDRKVRTKRTAHVDSSNTPFILSSSTNFYSSSSYFASFAPFFSCLLFSSLFAIYALYSLFSSTPSSHLYLALMSPCLLARMYMCTLARIIRAQYICIYTCLTDGKMLNAPCVLPMRRGLMPMEVIQLCFIGISSSIYIYRYNF